MDFSSRREFNSTTATSHRFEATEEMATHVSEQRKILLIMLLKNLISVTSTSLQLHSILTLNILAQHRALKQVVSGQFKEETEV